MSTQIITIVIILLFAFLSYRSYIGIVYSKGDTNIIIVHSLILVTLIGTLLGCYLFAPQKYSVNGNELIIHRLISNKIILIDSIKEIRQVDKSELRGMIRTFGVGGLFGNYGKFRTPSLGNIIMYATQNKNYVLIITDERKTIITPDDLQIIEQIKHKN